MALRRALAEWPRRRKVVVYASGGLSHFSSVSVLAYYGPYSLGSIDEEPDHQIYATAARENATRRLLVGADHGEAELRQWITPALWRCRPQWLVRAAHRAIMGRRRLLGAVHLPEPVGGAALNQPIDDGCYCFG